MENTEREKFESLWKDFLTLVKGKLISTAQKQSLSTPLANLILTDAAGSWDDEYSLYGRWLHQFSIDAPEKSSLIREIVRDMKFSEIEKKIILPSYCDYIIPGAGAIAGYVVSHCLSFGKLAQAATILIPAILLYPAVKMFRNNQEEIYKDKAINSYISQLEKYKNSILSVLS